MNGSGIPSALSVAKADKASLRTIAAAGSKYSSDLQPSCDTLIRSSLLAGNLFLLSEVDSRAGRSSSLGQ